MQRKSIRETSYLRYRITVEKHIIPELGAIQLSKLTTPKIQTFYNTKQKEGQSPSSLHTMQKVLHKALDYAVKVKLISYNPSSDVVLPRQTKRKVQPLTLEQARHLLHIAKGHYLEVFITLALATGMRHGEIVALRWDDIDFEQERVYVHRTAMYIGKGYVFEGEPKTETSERTIPLSPTVCPMLKEQKVRQNEVRLKMGARWQDHNLVVCNRYGNFLKAVSNAHSFYRLLEKAGLPRIHIHDLRHTASTLFRSLDVDMKVVQEMLGHSQMDVTANVYSHVLPSMHIQAVKKIEEGSF